MIRERTLLWDGCVNVRDLGGLETEDGGETRSGVVVRADSLRGLSEAGWRQLLDYGIGRIVDLRWHEELAQDPPSELPADLVHVPLFGDVEAFREVDRLTAEITDPVVWRQAQYVEALERFRPNFAEAIRAIADGGHKGVVVHCAGGVDRTGLVSALLLRLAGVDKHAVGADYAASEAAWRPTSAEWIEAADTSEEQARRRMLSVIKPETMAGVVDELERRYGSVERYLLDAGADGAAVDELRTRLRA